MRRKIKNKLKELAKQYKLKQIEFNSRQKQLINQFNLKRSERKEVSYSIIFPINHSLKKYTDILNSNSKLNKLNDLITDLFFTGNILIIRLIKENDTTISGYDLDLFIKNPSEIFQEINNLMKGLCGYKHIHTIGDKITLEILARDYLKKHYKLIRLIDYWFKKLDISVDE